MNVYGTSFEVFQNLSLRVWVKQQPIPAVGFCGLQAKSTKKNRDYPEEESTCARVTMIVASTKNEEDEGKPFQSEGTTNVFRK